LQSGVIQPDHASVVVRNLGPVVIVWCEMSMDDGMRVVSIRFVDVLEWSNGREDQARRGEESHNRAPRRIHDAVDYGSPAEDPSNTPSSVMSGVVRIQRDPSPQTVETREPAAGRVHETGASGC
jgi:hypothetical protein